VIEPLGRDAFPVGRLPRELAPRFQEAGWKPALQNGISTFGTRRKSLV